MSYSNGPVDEPFSCIGMDFKEMDESFNKNRFALVFQRLATIEMA